MAGASATCEEPTMPGTETRPVESDTDTGEGDGYAHYADKTEITRAAIEGGTVTALCGHKGTLLDIRPLTKPHLDTPERRI
jgi:hypothetical protein